MNTPIQLDHSEILSPTGDREVAVEVEHYLNRNHRDCAGNGGFYTAPYTAGTGMPGHGVYAHVPNEHDLPLLRGIAIGYADGFRAGNAAPKRKK